jgi:acyl-CoA ligase (AMP-forming) (exosortase A-associated)
MKPFLVQHFLDLTSDQYPAKVAVKHGKDAITFEQLYTKSNALAYGLKKFGIGKGERVGILLDKSIAQVLSILGVLGADFIFVLINSILKENQVRHILNDCNIKLLIASEKFSARFQNILKDTEVKIVVWESELDGIADTYAGKSTLSVRTGEDIGSIIYTSGSTGLPKGIVITHRNLIEGARIVSHYLGITTTERILGLLPFNFDYGLNQLISTLYKGCTIVLFKFFMPNSLLNILIDEKITGLPAIPTIWSAVFNPQLCKIDPDQQYPDLRYISNTGGKLPVRIVKTIRQLFPATKLYLMYGLTEAFRSTYLDPDEVDRRPDSIGKAIPTAWVEVINSKGKICEAGQVGELIHGGACVTKGYWNNPEMTARVFRPNPILPKENQFLDRVVYSGDLVKKDPEGFLYYVGRKDAMIKKEGYRVSPTEVEELLMGHQDVFEAVACGVERETAKNEIVALVTAKREIEVEGLYKFCRQRAPEYLVPDRILIMDKFAKTETGKIDRPRVIQEAHAKYNR